MNSHVDNPRAVLNAALGFNVSDEQYAAATADLVGPVLVTAGAGSGKTSVMAARVLWAVSTGQVEPDQVLGLTFTSKAASEFGGRVRQLVAAHTGDALDDDRLPTVSTYHSFAYGLVSEHGIRIGIEPGAQLLGEHQVAHIAHATVRSSRRDVGSIGKSVGGLALAVIELDQQLSENAVTTSAIREHSAQVVQRVDSLERTVARDRDLRAVAEHRAGLADLVDDFRLAKQRHGGIDFADLLRFGNELAQRDDVRQAMRRRWRMVLLDEYQDTSVVQARILAGLFSDGHCVTAVGDPMQAIYGWRGASAGAMDDFGHWFATETASEVRTLSLSTSQRSGRRILAAANALADPIRAESSRVVRLRPRTDSVDTNGSGGVRVALHETQSGEIEWLADRVAEQLRVGTPPSEVAVLCRTTADFVPVGRALTRRGVRYATSGSIGILSTPAVIDVLAYLQVIVDPSANPAMLRILTSSRLRIGPRDLAVLGRRAADLVRDSRRIGAIDLRDVLSGSDALSLPSLAEAVADLGAPTAYRYSGEARDRLEALARELDRLRGFAEQPIAEILQRVAATVGLDVEVRVSTDERGLAGLVGLQELVGAFLADATGGDLPSFLTWIRLIEELGCGPDIDQAAPNDCVTVMTVHKSKGLEWDVVVVPSLSDRVFPSSRGRARWTQHPSQVPHELRADKHWLAHLHSLGTAGHDQFEEELRATDVGEERRLAYVAVTRARRLLIASGHWWGPTQKRYRGPSRFLEEVHDVCATATTDDPWAAQPTEEVNPSLASAPVMVWPPVTNVGAERPPNVVPLTPEDHEMLAVWDSDIDALIDRRSLSVSERVQTLPRAISASELVEFTRRSVAKCQVIPERAPKRPSHAARRGSSFHEWVASRFDQHPLFEDVPGVTDAAEFSESDLARLQDGLASTPYAGLIPHAVEVPFEMAVDGVVIRGRIDAVYRVGHRWHIVDWKTGSGSRDDPLQLSVYRRAWAQISKVDEAQVQCYFVNVAKGQTRRPRTLPSVHSAVREIGYVPAGV